MAEIDVGTKLMAEMDVGTKLTAEEMEVGDDMPRLGLGLEVRAELVLDERATVELVLDERAEQGTAFCPSTDHLGTLLYECAPREQLLLEEEHPVFFLSW